MAWQLDETRSSDIESTWVEVDKKGRQTGQQRIMRQGAIIYRRDKNRLRTAGIVALVPFGAGIAEAVRYFT